MIKVNLGCGNKFLEDWMNIDFISYSPFVKQHDLRKGIPLESSSVDIVYHSHVLEHFTKQEGAFFLEECFRILKPNGILRIAIPDLEQLARAYIEMLDNLIENESEDINKANYEWSVIELIDQMVREKPGGNMIDYWMKEKIINHDYIEKRLGNEFILWRIKHLKQVHLKNEINQERKIDIFSSFFRRLSNRWKKYWLDKWNISMDDLRVGKFRNSGESHKWMYDFFSLKSLLQSIGFTKIEKTNAFESSIPNWDSYKILDVEEGRIRKPDSLFIEAKKLVFSD